MVKDKVLRNIISSYLQITITLCILETLAIFKYRIYSCERPRRSFNFGFSKPGGVLIRVRRSFDGSAHWIYQKDIKILPTCLFRRTIRAVIIKCFMFKILRKTPLFTKEKVALQAKLAALQNFLCNSQMSDSFKWYFSNERL